ncbi:MAG: hypothetical protein SRB1_00378 [Desulfobacteraceae bacterium Eth-SRB1]|nr:MAG: hypothetical protein SRB1_00378 [Desulfobacteraceae bacterium Eth-SRB1]
MSDKKTTKKSTKAPEGIQVTLEPNENIPPRRIYSNYIHVAQTPYDFSLKFCDAVPLSGNNTGGKVTHSIPIVAEIALPFNLIPGFIDALQAQYKLYKDNIGRVESVKKTSKK